MTKDVFKDHFSGHAASYSVFRPVYPDTLYTWLADLAPGHDLAWDCATGNGQAARGLARHFRKVIATDASAEQIRQAEGPGNVSFRTEPAQTSSLEPGSAELVTVAQAYHWLDHEAFVREVRRVTCRNGVLAIWAYQLASVSPAVDAVVRHLYGGVLDAFWPDERRWVESGYRDFQFPWPDLPPRSFHMEMEWSRETFCGYLRTWSASRRHQLATGIDAVESIEGELATAWRSDGVQTVRWPLIIRAFRVSDKKA